MLLKSDYQKLRIAHHRMLLRILGSWGRWRDHLTFLYDIIIQKTLAVRALTSMCARLKAGAFIQMKDIRFPKQIMSGKLEKPE